jgi:hypothetical protein
MTPFIESFQTKQLLPPWRAKEARTWSFAIRLQEARIAAYLKKYFNDGYPDEAPYFYEPLPGPQFGLLSVCHFPQIESLYDAGHGSGSDGNAWDGISHTEVYMAFPAVRYRRTVESVQTEPSLVWVQPAVYTNHDSIVFSSREIWGTDMFLATIEQDPSTEAFHLDAGIVGIKRFDPRSYDQLLAILHIRAGQESDLDLRGILNANPDLQEFVNILGGSGLFADHQLPPGVAASRYPEGVELNNVKQFRDCYDMATAIYRAIVASQTSYTNVNAITFYDAAKVELDFMWSDSIAEFLVTILDATPPDPRTPGLGPPDGHKAGPAPGRSVLDWDMDRVPIKVELAFAFTADIDFRVLSTLHTYGVGA